jgi:TonB family protein
MLSADELQVYKFADKFTGPAMQSPPVGGTADTRYFAIVYNMIRSHFREPQGQETPHGGVIVFTVDSVGKLLQRKVLRSSGSPSLDVAAMKAIAEAAPYPTPPESRTRSMRLTYGK